MNSETTSPIENKPAKAHKLVVVGGLFCGVAAYCWAMDGRVGPEILNSSSLQIGLAAIGIAITIVGIVKSIPLLKKSHN